MQTLLSKECGEQCGGQTGGKWQLRFEVLQVETHDFSARDEAALHLNEVISDWAKSGWPQIA